MLYPLKFKPILKQTIWGGDKLACKSDDPGEILYRGKLGNIRRARH